MFSRVNADTYYCVLRRNFVISLTNMIFSISMMVRDLPQRTNGYYSLWCYYQSLHPSCVSCLLFLPVPNFLSFPVRHGAPDRVQARGLFGDNGGSVEGSSWASIDYRPAPFTSSTTMFSRDSLLGAPSFLTSFSSLWSIVSELIGRLARFPALRAAVVVHDLFLAIYQRFECFSMWISSVVVGRVPPSLKNSLVGI